MSDKERSVFEVNLLPVWRGIKTVTPPVITGAYDTGTGDRNPGEALYNLLFVRVPTIVAGLLYFQRTAEGKPEIVMDLGLGQFELPAMAVIAIMYIILRPST
jgi:hypothetical protein